jgi:Na+-driven multidrug efflux pump
MAGMGLVFFCLPSPLLRLFTDDPEVTAFGTSLLRIVAVIQIPMAIALVLSGSLRGAGDTVSLFWSTAIGNWGIRVPFAWLCAAVWHMDLRVVWGLMAADWLVRMSVLGYRYRAGNWHRLHPSQEEGTTSEVSLSPLRAA